MMTEIRGSNRGWWLCVCAALLTLCSGSAAVAQDAAEVAVTPWKYDLVGPAPSLEGVPNIAGLLFVGTSSNLNDPSATANDVFTVDPMTDVPASILTGTQVWGATADPANQRVLFTRASGLPPPAGEIGGGDDLWAVPYGGGTPALLGRIVDGAGDGFRIDGLAMSGGVLYGTNAAATPDNGFYSIDLTTFLATPIALFADSISGLDADPDSGVIYGVNDTTAQVVTISTAGAITNVVAYPSGLTDIDGIAVGNGKAYLVTDEPGSIPVYDLGAASFGTALTSPFAVLDTFSGAAIAVGSTIFRDGFESGDTSAWSGTTP